MCIESMRHTHTDYNVGSASFWQRNRVMICNSYTMVLLGPFYEDELLLLRCDEASCHLEPYREPTRQRSPCHPKTLAIVPAVNEHMRISIFHLGIQEQIDSPSNTFSMILTLLHIRCNSAPRFTSCTALSMS